MAKPWCSFRLGLGVGLFFLLTSCLELSVAVNFRTSTAGQIEINALSYRLAQGLHMVDGPDRAPLPTTRAEWQVLVDQVAALSQAGATAPIPGTSSGLTLVSWESQEEDLGTRTKTVLSFSNARALEGLFTVFKQKLTLLQANDGRWTLTFVPQVPRVTAADAETRKLWTALWGPSVWTFGFTPPGRPRVERSVTLAELAGDRVLSEWTTTW